MNKREGSFFPRVSVVMPVHNGGRYLVDTLASLSAQSFDDFELLLVDDASTDDTVEIMRNWVRQDKRGRIIRSAVRGGAGRSTALGFREARGEFIARMDGDDLAEPDRLACQVSRFGMDDKLGVLGTAALVFGQSQSYVLRPPSDDASVRAWSVFGMPFVSPTMMFRSNLRDRTPSLCEDFSPVEDYDLSLRLLAVTKAANLSEPLLRYRVHSGQYTAKKGDAHFAALRELRLGWLRERGIIANETEQLAHLAAAMDYSPGASVELAVLARWLRRLRMELPQSGWATRKTMSRLAGEQWWAAARRESGGIRLALTYLRGPIGRFGRRVFGRAVRLLANRSSG